MTRFLIAAAVVAMFAVSMPDQAEAQYGHIRGRSIAPCGQQGVFGFTFDPNSYNSFHRPTNLPYFAQHPPVYYSRDIVKRPYGVSPYAAPAGVVPVEMNSIHQSRPVHISNPYVDSNIHDEQFKIEEGVIGPPEAPSVSPDEQPNLDPDSQSDSPSEKKTKDGDWEILSDKDDT